MFKTLKKVPVSLAVVFMVLMMLAGVVLGNRNALQDASASAWKALDKVGKRVEELSGKAANYLVIASRIKLTGDAYDALAQARSDADKLTQGNLTRLGDKAAITLEERADALESAVLALDKEIKAYAANMEEGGSKKLEQEARDKAYSDWCNTIQAYYEEMELYNLQALYAQDFYESLPTRALLSSQLPPLFH